jgi:hypothetical protein
LPSISSVLLTQLLLYNATTLVAPHFLRSNALANSFGVIAVDERKCSRDFREVEEKAKQEAKDWRQVDAPVQMSNLLFEFHKSVGGDGRYCGYDFSDFRILLWTATKILWYKSANGTIMPHTAQAFADMDLRGLWEIVLSKGLYGFPRNEELARCWRFNAVSDGQKCHSLDTKLFRELDSMKLPTGWN